MHAICPAVGVGGVGSAGEGLTQPVEDADVHGLQGGDLDLRGRRLLETQAALEVGGDGCRELGRVADAELEYLYGERSPAG